MCSSLIARLLHHRRFCSSEPESAKLLEAPIAVAALEWLTSWQAASLAGSLPKLETPRTGNRGTATDALAAAARVGTSAGLAPVRELPFFSNPHCR